MITKESAIKFLLENRERKAFVCFAGFRGFPDPIPQSFGVLGQRTRSGYWCDHFAPLRCCLFERQSHFSYAFQQTRTVFRGEFILHFSKVGTKLSTAYVYGKLKDERSPV